MEVVTTGRLYLDIDAYAGIVAYAELLQAQGLDAAAVSGAPFNSSVSRTIRLWSSPLKTDYRPDPDDTFAVIDVSNPEHFDGMVNLSRVVTVIDHHVGFESYWHDRIGDNASIEFIGAACTLVYERWQRAGLLDSMSQLSARLLVSGILDNTLNFGASVTDQRDIDAHTELVKRAGLPDGWTAQYFGECQESILQNVGLAIGNDTKRLQLKSYAGPVRTAQLAVWDGQSAIKGRLPEIESSLGKEDGDWLVNLISVGERCSYFVSANEGVRQWLSGLAGVAFERGVARADRLWLRKELIKKDAETGI